MEPRFSPLIYGPPQREKNQYGARTRLVRGILGYVHTGPVPNGSDPILERTISVHTVPFRLSKSVHTGPICYCSVLNRSKKSSRFYQLSMRRIHVVAFKMAPKYQKEPIQVFTR